MQPTFITTQPWLGVTATTIPLALLLVATGCGRHAGTPVLDRKAPHGHRHDHGREHGHAHDAEQAVGDFPAAVAEVVRLDDRIQRAFAANDPAAADEPVHEIGHLLERLPGLATAHGQGIDVDAVKKSSGLLFEAYSRIDDKLHGGEGSDYGTEAQVVARELEAFRAFLVPARAEAGRR